MNSSKEMVVLILDYCTETFGVLDFSLILLLERQHDNFLIPFWSRLITWYEIVVRYGVLNQSSFAAFLRAVRPRRHAMFLFLQQEASRIIGKFFCFTYLLTRRACKYCWTTKMEKDLYNSLCVYPLLKSKNSWQLSNSDSWCYLVTPMIARRQS